MFLKKLKEGDVKKCKFCKKEVQKKRYVVIANQCLKPGMEK